VSALAEALIERRREKMTLDALGDLIRYLRAAGEERKAILAITEGWRLFRPNWDLLSGYRDDTALGLPPAGFDPVTGRLGTRDQDTLRARSACERDRQMLAMADNEQQFRFMLDAANQANASFYPVNPRGLAVFDSPIGPDRPLSPAEDRARLRARQHSLRTLADLTDGLAVVNTNNLTENLQRVVEDLSFYHLLGYYASGVKMDGKFHNIRVCVTRPGVAVRARRGYLASSREEMLAARRPPKWRERMQSSGPSGRWRGCRARCRCACRWPQAGRPQAPRPSMSWAKSAGTTNGRTVPRWM